MEFFTQTLELENNTRILVASGMLIIVFVFFYICYVLIKARLNRLPCAWCDNKIPSESCITTYTKEAKKQEPRDGCKALTNVTPVQYLGCEECANSKDDYEGVLVKSNKKSPIIYLYRNQEIEAELAM